MVFHIDMCPAKLPDLVIHNPTIAQALLICMTNSAEISKYLDVLTYMKLSITLLEVFHDILQKVDFPKEFILLFVKNCMDQCSASTETKVLKNRMVRLVIVFLQNILKQKILDFEDISTSIKQFCMEHNTSKEAQDMLKKVIAEQSF